MKSVGYKLVTAESTTAEIMEAINREGKHRHSRRKHDWADKDDNNQRSWVIPDDIGESTREDTSLLRRLRNLVREGLLEERDHGSYTRLKNNFPCADIRIAVQGRPRFRVVKK